MQIYGIEVELEEPDEGSMVTDVMVIARQVSFENGRAHDSTLVSCSSNTTGIIQQGMVSDVGIHLTADYEE